MSESPYTSLTAVKDRLREIDTYLVIVELRITPFNLLAARRRGQHDPHVENIRNL